VWKRVGHCGAPRLFLSHAQLAGLVQKQNKGLIYYINGTICHKMLETLGGGKLSALNLPLIRKLM